MSSCDNAMSKPILYRLRYGLASTMLLAAMVMLAACGKGAVPETTTSSAAQESPQGVGTSSPPASPTAQVAEEPPLNSCVSDPAQAPGGFDPSFDLQTNISSYLMMAQDLGDIEGLLASMCGSLWDYADEPLIAESMIADINGDERDDLLLSITFPLGGSLGDARIYAYARGGGGMTPYLILEILGGERAEGLYTGGGGEFLDVVDMNHEGPPEIVLAVHWDTYSEYYIANWSEQGVQSLIRYADELGMERRSILVQQGSVRIEDNNGDGLLDLVVERAAIEGATASQPSRTEVWSWNGEMFASQGSESSGALAAPTALAQAGRGPAVAPAKGLACPLNPESYMRNRKGFSHEQ